MTSSTLVDNASVSNDAQELKAPCNTPMLLRTPPRLTRSNRDTTGKIRDRPCLSEALAASLKGDTLVAPRAKRPTRSLPDATDTAEKPKRREVHSNVGKAVYDLTDPETRLLSNVIGIMARFESVLIRARTREVKGISKMRGKVQGRRPKLSSAQEQHEVALNHGADHSVVELVDLFDVSPASVPRAIDRHPVDVPAAVKFPRGGE